MTTEKETVARCAIYDKRPAMCVEYPKRESYIPAECTYNFTGETRTGSCDCGIGACCAIPRVDGEPTSPSLPAEAGGLPCKHLIWVEVEKEKTAEVEKVASATQQYTSEDVYSLVRGPE
jgi:Fe-S-cluster containining protein